MTLLTLFRDMPIRRKLTLITLLSAGVALLFAALIAMAQQWVLLRAELEKITDSQASIIATNSASALLFNDQKSAIQTLAALRAFEDVEFAILHDKQGKPFATFVPAGHILPPPHPLPQERQHHFTAAYLDVFHPVMFEGDQLGMIHMRSSLAHVYKQMVWSVAVVAAAALAAMGLALLLIGYLHPAITGPIAELVSLMGVVTNEKDYGVRAKSPSKDELGALAHGFNEMLAQIQARDRVLEQYSQDLEEEVTQRTASLTEAQRIAHLGNWEWDVVNNRLVWSDEIYRIFGLEAQQFGASYEALLQAVHPEDRQTVVDAVQAALEHNHPYSIDHRILLPGGAVRHVHEQAEVLRNDDGLAIKMLGTVQDITERKQAEENIRRLNEGLEVKVQERTQQLLQAQDELLRKEKLSMLGQVAGSVGHELRNPLGVMNNAVYFLQTVLSEADETTKEYLGIIEAEIANADRIVGDLLDSVRTKPPQPGTVSVGDLIDQALGKCEIPDSVTVTLGIPEILSPLRVDAQQIGQVFRNLISNAAEAMPDGGTLEIGAVENSPDKTITISVRDTGSGITPEDRSRLFQPLFTTKARGIGLGLVVVKNLTQANGGSIEVQSEAGKGAVFSVTLPCEA